MSKSTNSNTTITNKNDRNNCSCCGTRYNMLNDSCNRSLHI